MEPVFELSRFLGPSVCDASGHLSYPGAFGLFQDMAAAHAEPLGVGFEAMAAKGLFWLTVKTKIVFLKRPKIDETVLLRTWPEKPGAIRCHRSYELLQDGEPCLLGRTEWAVTDIGTHALVPPAALFPAELDYPPAACAEAFARIPPRTEDFSPCGEHLVRSTDIDVGGHMNNAAYLLAVFGALTSAEIAAREIRTVDAIFRAPCFEGDRLTVERREAGGCLDLRLSRGGESVFLARLA